MNESNIHIDDIIRLIDHFAKQDLESLVLEIGQTKLSLQGKQSILNSVETMDPDTILPRVSNQQNIPVVKDITRQEEQSNMVKAPIVGTFYQSPAPDQSAFVTVGQKVKKGDVLFIIESMKLMNEVKSEIDGEVLQILCDDGQPVEYGQSVMIIK